MYIYMYICMCECICICICHDDAYILRDGEQSQKDLHKCQKRPTQVSKETYTSVKRDLHKCQKRPSQVSKENNRGIMHACHVCCKEMKNNIGQTKYAAPSTPLRPRSWPPLLPFCPCVVRSEPATLSRPRNTVAPPRARRKLGESLLPELAGRRLSLHTRKHFPVLFSRMKKKNFSAFFNKSKMTKHKQSMHTRIQL